MGKSIREKLTMKKKIIFLILSFITIYLILSYKGVIRTKYYIERYKNHVKTIDIDKKLNEVLTPLKLLEYYEKLKALRKKTLMNNRNFRILGTFYNDGMETGFFSENNRSIFDLNVYFDKLSFSDKQKLKKNNGKKVILTGRIRETVKEQGLLVLYVGKVEFENN